MSGGVVALKRMWRNGTETLHSTVDDFTPSL